MDFKVPATGQRERRRHRIVDALTPVMIVPRISAVAAVLLLGLCLLPSRAAAQDGSLRAATIAASSAAAADWISTYHALKFFKVRETNPLLRPIDNRPGAMVSVGALIDVGAITTWNMTMGKKHPRIAAAGLWAMTAFRAYLAIHNFRTERAAGRR